MICLSSETTKVQHRLPDSLPKPFHLQWCLPIPSTELASDVLDAGSGLKLYAKLSPLLERCTEKYAVFGFARKILTPCIVSVARAEAWRQCTAEKCTGVLRKKEMRRIGRTGFAQTHKVTFATSLGKFCKAWYLLY